MISKIYRLKENEVKKVLWKRSKPFFSYSLVLNSLKNKQTHNRFSIVIGSKSVNSGVSRNFFRRLFYENSRKYLELAKENSFFDFTILIKKETQLNKADQKIVQDFTKDLNFVFSKFFEEEKANANIKFNFKK